MEYKVTSAMPAFPRYSDGFVVIGRGAVVMHANAPDGGIHPLCRSKKRCEVLSTGSCLTFDTPTAAAGVSSKSRSDCHALLMAFLQVEMNEELGPP